MERRKSFGSKTNQEKFKNKKPKFNQGNKSSEKPGEKPIGRPGEKPIRRPSEKPVGRTGEKPTRRPGEKPTRRPGEKPIGKSGGKPSGKSFDRPAGKLFNKPSNNFSNTKPQEPYINPKEERDLEGREGIISGRRPIIEALKSGMEINKVFVLDGQREGSVKEIVALANEKKVPLVFIDRKKLDELVPGEKSQGVAASIPPVNYADIDDILKNETNYDIIVVLDGIEDPHNLGAIIRSAEISGTKGVIIPKRRGVLVTETVARASAGAVLHLPVARVANLVQTVEDLKKKGYWVVGADMAGEGMWKANMKLPLVLVIGNEGKGISRLLKEHCDFLVGIPVSGKIASLNASVASGVLLYEIIRQNQG